MSSKKAELCVERADNEFLDELNFGVGGCSSMSEPGLANMVGGVSIVKFPPFPPPFSPGGFALKYPPIPIMKIALLFFHYEPKLINSSN
jgi:hypothetical protein